MAAPRANLVAPARSALALPATPRRKLGGHAGAAVQGAPLAVCCDAGSSLVLRPLAVRSCSAALESAAARLSHRHRRSPHASRPGGAKGPMQVWSIWKWDPRPRGYREKKREMEMEMEMGVGADSSTVRSLIVELGFRFYTCLVREIFWIWLF